MVPAVRDVDQRKRCGEPNQQRAFAADRRRKQRDDADGEHGRSDGDETLARRCAITPCAEQRIEDAIEETQHEQQQAERCQRDAQVIAVELGQMHVKRQRSHRERHPQQAVGDKGRGTDAGLGKGCGGARLRPASRHCWPSSFCRKSEREVFGSSQMPKNACAKPGSAISPMGLPLWKYATVPAVV